MSKQLLPVYDKPMIYYPLSTLMLAGIREILVITTPHDQDAFRRLLGDGSELGLSISYAVQPHPDGLAQAFIIGARLRRGRLASRWCSATTSSTATGLPESLRRPPDARRAAGVRVPGPRPERYGVVEFDAQRQAISIEEKPAKPRVDRTP